MGSTSPAEQTRNYGVSLGFRASANNNSIVLNAQSTPLNGTATNAFYVAPVRSAVAGSNLLFYTTSKEVTYGPSGTSTGDYLVWNASTATWTVAGSTGVALGAGADAGGISTVAVGEGSSAAGIRNVAVGAGGK